MDYEKMSVKRESTLNGGQHSGSKRFCYSDPREDIESCKKDEHIKGLKNRIDSLEDRLRARDSEHSETLQEKTRLKDELDEEKRISSGIEKLVYTIKKETAQEISHLKNLLAEKEHELDEEKKKSSGNEKLVIAMNKSGIELAQQLAAAKAMGDEHQRQSKCKQKTIDYLKTRLEVDEKRHNMETLTYEDNNDGLRKNFHELKAKIKCLTNELSDVRQSLGEHQTKCASLETDNLVLRDQLKSSDIEKSKLKRQVMYFKKANELNKKKFIGESVTAIKQMNLYFEAMNRLCRTSQPSRERLMNRFKDVLNEENRLNQREQVQEKTTVRKKYQQIQAAEERVVEKRPESRVQCLECARTFVDTRALTIHMTVTHKKNEFQ